MAAVDERPAMVAAVDGFRSRSNAPPILQRPEAMRRLFDQLQDRPHLLWLGGGPRVLPRKELNEIIRRQRIRYNRNDLDYLFQVAGDENSFLSGGAAPSVIRFLRDEL